MQELSGSGVLPSVLFLDLNMPRKNGFECLSEINVKESLKDLPVIIFSTSYDSEVVKKLYSDGAHFYVRKPNEFEKLKIVIQQALLLTTQPKYTRPSMENFVLNS
jgi:CheY-like chemotaxis protein